MTFKNWLIRSVSTAAVILIIAGTGFAQVPLSKRVILIIDENHTYKDVRADMPWLNSLGKANGYATKYQSDNGGSLLDYLWLASGSCHSAANCKLPAGTHDFNCNGNDCYYPGTKTTDPITDDNIFREMNNAGISWKVYAESYAAAGGTPTTPDNANGTSYYRRHNGAVWYSDILSNVDNSASKVVDLAQLSVDLTNNALPQFMIIVPNGHDDAHDCPTGMKTCTAKQQLAVADKFLSDTLTPILATADFQPGGTGLVFVTFDECGGGTDNGCGASVYTAVIGPTMTPHAVSRTLYKHENTLRTIFDALGLANYPGAAATASDMSDFFAVSGSVPVLVAGSPANGATVSTPVSLVDWAYPTTGHVMDSWRVFVDGALAYHQYRVGTITPSLPLNNGQHSLVIRASDTSGAISEQTVSVNVNATPLVALSTPGDGANVGAPVNVIAFASPTAGHSLTGWWVYVDGARIYNAGAVNQINASIPMSIGTHSMIVRAWDNSGAFGDQTVTLNVGNTPAVAVAAPLTGTNVISPFNVQASATPTIGNHITGWIVYVDNGSAYKTSGVNSINANITASAGGHSILVRSWDSSGAFGDQTLKMQVGKVAVNISAPLNGASVNSPVSIQAAASSANSVATWHIYVDSVDSFTQSGGNSINTNLEMNSGIHSVLVRAWDSTGAYADQTITVVVPLP